MSQLADVARTEYQRGYEQGYMDGKNDADRDIAMLQTRLYKTSESMSKVMMFETGKPIAVIHSDGGQTTFDLGYEQGKKDAVVHSKWVDNGIEGSMLSKCQECGFPCGAHSFNYCPNCGAKMDAQEGTELN